MGEDGEISGKQYTYDGQILKQVRAYRGTPNKESGDIDNPWERIEDYYYNDYGLLEKKHTTGHYANQENLWEIDDIFERNDTGKIMRSTKIINNNNGTKEERVSTYNNDELVTEEIRTKYEGNKLLWQERYVYTYNDRGDILTLHQYWDPDDKGNRYLSTKDEYFYIYNEAGDVTKMERITVIYGEHKTEIAQFKWVEDYYYDEIGLMTRREYNEYKNGSLTSATGYYMYSYGR